jgi:hypothetical protein
METIFTVALLLCVSPAVPKADAVTFAKVAHAKGYSVQLEEGPGCAASLWRGKNDAANAYVLSYDDTRRLTAARAGDIVLAWEAQLLNATKGE